MSIPACRRTVLIFNHSDAKFHGGPVKKVYTICGVWTIFLWFIYPIAWGLCEGGNVISPDSEAVFYGVLDILAKPVFGALLIFGHRNIDPASLGLHLKDYDDSNQVIEKDGSRANNGNNGVANNGALHQGNANVDGANDVAPTSTGVHNNTANMA
jgi:bacteriorhodopsin